MAKGNSNEWKVVENGKQGKIDKQKGGQKAPKKESKWQNLREVAQVDLKQQQNRKQGQKNANKGNGKIMTKNKD